MEYVTLNNGIKMPMAGIGTFLLTPDEAEASVLNALACGYRLIDTANAYVNEKAVGRAMKKSGVSRRRFFPKPSCGLPSTSSLMLWKRHWSGWTPTTLTCCSSTSPLETISPVTS